MGVVTTTEGTLTTGAVTTAGTGSGRPNEKPKRTPAWADKFAAPIRATARNNLVFVSFNLLMFFNGGCSVGCTASLTVTVHLMKPCRRIGTFLAALRCGLERWVRSSTGFKSSRVLRCGKGYFADSVVVGVRHINVSRTVRRYSAGTIESCIRSRTAGASQTRDGGHHSQGRDFSEGIVASVRHIDISLVVNRQTLGIPKPRILAVAVGVARTARQASQCACPPAGCDLSDCAVGAV